MPDLDALITRISSYPLFGHQLLFSDRHPHPDAPFHRDMIELYWSGAGKVAILAFRNAAKSTKLEQALVLGGLTKRFQYGVILCATVERAVERLRSVKYELETNGVIDELFGDMRGDVWQQSRIILKNNICIDAIGCGQSVRGMKFLSYRPDFVFADDIEELSPYLDNVSTPERREDLSRWFYGVFVPALAQDAKLRLAGTMLHEESLIGRAARSPHWQHLIVPVAHIDAKGTRAASWPEVFPLSRVDAMQAEAIENGQLESFAQEYMCTASSPQARAFKEDMLRFDGRPRTWEPCYVIYDPARTVGPKSCATGKIVASWIGGRLLVWEAVQAFWQPDEIIADIFETNRQYAPIAIGVEVTGLNQFIEQPLRQAQIARGSIPLRPVNPPRGQGKENFLLRLQPFFAAGEVIFMGPRDKFQKLIDELLGFPYGLKDTLNALAYMLEIRPGEPVHPSFGNAHAVNGFQPAPQAVPCLLLNSDGTRTSGILVETIGGTLRVIADWIEESSPGSCLPAMIRAARGRAGASLSAHAPMEHFKPHDAIGLIPAATASGQDVLRGGDPALGQADLRRMMLTPLGGDPLFQVSREASWTLRAMSGGYARATGETQAVEGPYRLIGEALDGFAAVSGGILAEEDNGSLNYRFTPDGRKYLSHSICLPRRRRA